MSTPLAVAAGYGLVVMLVAMTLLWLLSLRVRDSSIVDPFWGPGFALVTLTYFVSDARFQPRATLVLVIVAAWAARLGFHLLIRNRREGEDPRYKAMAEPHGDRWWWVSLYRVFWLQGVLLWIISAPLLASVVSSRPLGLWDLLGAVTVVVGLAIEAAADAQLARFRADPTSKGRVLDTGLWRYSRHPNYFGDAVVWWGFYMISVGAGAAWTVYGPALMTYFLVRVSGVALLEKGLKSSRPGYAEYVERTSTFIPWPPKG